jgi:hypothetical protein
MGTLVGRLFDPHIVPWSLEMVGAVNGVLGINYWNWNGGGNPNEFTLLPTWSRRTPTKCWR